MKRTQKLFEMASVLQIYLFWHCAEFCLKNFRLKKYDLFLVFNLCSQYSLFHLVLPWGGLTWCLSGLEEASWEALPVSRLGKLLLTNEPSKENTQRQILTPTLLAFHFKYFSNVHLSGWSINSVNVTWIASISLVPGTILWPVGSWLTLVECRKRRINEFSPSHKVHAAVSDNHRKWKIWKTFVLSCAAHIVCPKATKPF